MTNLQNELDDDRFRFLMLKATQIRKLLLGSMLISKDAWKDALLGTPEGLGVLKTIEAAEEKFIDPTITEPFARLDNILAVINDRARAVVLLMEHIAKFAPPKTQSADMLVDC